MGLITPYFKVLADSQDITQAIKKRLVSLAVKDESGLKSDTAEIVLDDRGNDVALPRTGAELTIYLGYKEESLALMGVYIVDEITLSGPPETMAIRAKAANMRQSLKATKTRTWQKEGTTPEKIKLVDIVKKIAQEHGLEPKISGAFSGIDYDVINQVDESDINLLTRLARDLGGIAKPTPGLLVFAERGAAKSVSGQNLAEITLAQKDVTSYQATFQERGKFSTVSARYHDQDAAKTVDVTVGQGEPVYSLRKAFNAASDALNAAAAKLADYQRGTATVSVTAPGDPRLLAETKLTLSGFRDGYAGPWIVKDATHTISGAGYTMNINAESKKGA
jgi:uncharacterized protein